MFELARISLHNWYLIDALDIQIDGHTAIIGQTGAGKSSILDAIQTVISGNNRNMLELNAAAGNERSRSVRDYMLGCVSDVNEGKPRLARAESTLALTFKDREKNESVAVGLFMKADQNNAETTKRFVAPRCDFKIEDHMSSKGGREIVDSHDLIIERLREQVGQEFSFYPSSTKFVGAYLEAMRPELTPDPKHFMRAFSNALLTKEISDPTDFMRRFVLEPIPLDMKGVKSSIEIWREMTGEVDRVENMISDLSLIAHNYQTGFGIMINEADLNILERKVDTYAQRIKVRSLESEKEGLRKDERSLIRQEGDLAGQVAESEKEMEGLREILRGSEAGSQAALADAELRACLERQNGIKRQAESLLKPLFDLKNLDKEVFPEPVQDMASDARYLHGLCENRTPEEWVSIRTDITAASKQILEHADIPHSLRQARDSAADKASTLRRRLADIGDVSGASSPPLYSRQVRDFMAVLEHENIEHAILPELVEITDQSWTFALEALLGPNREALLVDDKDLSKAFDILFRHRNQFDTVRLINTRRLRQSGPRQVQESVAAIAETDNEDIRRFIDYSVGRYVRAEGEEDLTSHRAAILRNGKTNSGATVRVFRDRPSILGAGAREKAGAEITREASEIRQDLLTTESNLASIDTAVSRYMAAGGSTAEDIKAALDSLSETMIEARSLRQKKSAIDDTKASEAEAKLSGIREHLHEMKPELDKVRSSRRTIEVQLAIIDEKIKHSSHDIETLIAREQEAIEARNSENMKSLEAMVETKPLPELIEDEDFASLMEMPLQSTDEALTGYRARLAEARSSLTRSGQAAVFVKRGNNGLLSFAQKWLIEDAPLSEDAQDEDRFSWVSRKLERYRANDLLQYRERLEQARDEMEASLKEGLVSKLGEQFALLKQQVDSLNRRLERHQFVGQTYQFRSSVSARFLPIYELVQTALDPEGDLESEEAQAGLAELEAILDSDDEDIKRFGDYRNYFTFELYIEHPDPKDASVIKSTPLSAVLGKLSGGQRQAPYYVAIAASMVSAYYPKSHAGDTEGMGLTLFDEAFNRLDIPNTQRLMALFRSLGLQVLVAVPEDKRATLIEAVDSVITVSRIPGTEDVFIDTSGIGPKAKEAMLKENPVHQTAPA